MKALYLQYTNPAFYPPLEHSARILADAGWQVRFLGVHSATGKRPALAEHPRIDCALMEPVRTGWRQKLHYAAFCARALATAISWRPDWVYASDALSCPAALLLSFLPGIRVIYHEHDAPDETRRSGLFQKLVMRARSRVAATAELCVFPNQERLERFCATHPRIRRAIRTWNCPSLPEVAPARTASESGDFWLLYHGSLSPARLPHTVLEALVLLPDAVKLRIVGYETAGFPTFLRDFDFRARQLGVAERLEIAGFVTREELLELCRKSHVGFALMPSHSTDWNEQTMSGASSKAFEYLAGGLAVLVSDLAGWNSLFVEPGCARNCIPESPESIAAAVRWFLEHRGETHRMGERGRARVIEEWNYETQFAPVLRILEGKGEDTPAPAPEYRELRRTNP